MSLLGWRWDSRSSPFNQAWLLPAVMQVPTCPAATGRCTTWRTTGCCLGRPRLPMQVGADWEAPAGCGWPLVDAVLLPHPPRTPDAQLLAPLAAACCRAPAAGGVAVSGLEMVQNRVGLMWSREEVRRTGCVPHFQQVHGTQVQHSGRSCSFCPSGLRQAEAHHAGGLGRLAGDRRNVSTNFAPQQRHAVLPAPPCHLRRLHLPNPRPGHLHDLQRGSR